MNRLPTGAALLLFHEYNNARPYFIKLRICGEIDGGGELLKIIEKVGEPAIGELKEKSGYGWSKLYRILRSLIEKGLVCTLPEKRRKKEGIRKMKPETETH